MADWIPWHKSILNKPEVLSISKATSRSRREVVCILMEFWSWADGAATPQGELTGVDLGDLRGLIQDTDEPFWRAVVAAGWLQTNAAGLLLPNFNCWLGANRRLRPPPKGKRPAKVDMGDIALPPELDTPEFRVAWNEWVYYRRQETRHALTVLAAQQHIKKCKAWGVAVAIEAINESISNGWRGLFPPKGVNVKERNRDSFIDGLFKHG